MNVFSIMMQVALPLVEEAASAEKGLSLFDLIMKGGWVMLPIFLLSFLSVYIFIERYLYINTAGKINPELLRNVKTKLNQGRVEEAIEFCAIQNQPMGRILERGLSRVGTSIRDVESALDNSARVEIAYLEKNLNILAAIAAIAPMFGFLGTVTGMIKAFYHISLADTISIGIIAGGIYEKMVTSAAGLVVGVLAYIFYTSLNTLIDRKVTKMEVTAIQFTDILFKASHYELQER